MDLHFVKGRFTEAELEKAIITLFEQQGYAHIDANTLPRADHEILLKNDLTDYLNRRYSDLTPSESNAIIARLENIQSAPLYHGNKEAYLLINEGFNLTREDANKLALHIDFIDFNNSSSNHFKIVSQLRVHTTKEARRPDLLIFINGIPVSILEFKSAIREETTIHDAWKQITIRYNRDIPQLMKYCFLSVISDGANSRLGSIFTPYKYYYAWNKVNEQEKVSNGISALFAMLAGAFTQERLLGILQDFVYYPDDSTDDLAVVTRYPQFFAANKMFERIKQGLRPNGDGKGGTYFGATGCGKTYTMLFLSRLLGTRERDVFQSPTILIITDREDLDRQTSELFVTSKRYLKDKNVKSIESRKELKEVLDRESGGVFLTTIQKFSEQTGLISDRSNIICISDEAHRTQAGLGQKLKITEKGVTTSYGFAKHLRDSFPNATYTGFTGTPVDETTVVFGEVVDTYTMKEASDDGITVAIDYEPRLARVILSDDKAKEIQQYYGQCIDDGASEDQVEISKKAMSHMERILGDPDRLKMLALDMVTHYEQLTAQKPNIIQKAMIVCSKREIAFALLQAIGSIRPEWLEPRKSNKPDLSKTELDKLTPLAKINLVATRDKDDQKELYQACGTKEYRQMLAEQFKDNDSNFKIAIVVDMWITGFDAPSMAVMYIDKPLQKHTLIQTISRVNRVFEGKDKGLVVDYIGIKEDMQKALAQYGKGGGSPINEIGVSLAIFRNHLSLLDALLHGFDKVQFFTGEPLERLTCLGNAAEYVQTEKDRLNRFMDLSRKLKAAYAICSPSGEVTTAEIISAEFYLATRSIIYKQTKGDAPDAEVMNAVVEKMVEDAITCVGIEDVINNQDPENIMSEAFLEQLNEIKMPISKFNALLKLLKTAIAEYGKVNKVKSIEFDQRLREVVDKYNTRDNTLFVSEAVSDFIDGLSDELIKLFQDVQEDKGSFETLGISYEEKAFFDILVKVRDDHGFQYDDDKCVILAGKIKELVADKSQFADWLNREDIKNQLNMELTILLYDNGYPPQWDEEIFQRVLEQAENFRKYD